MQKNELYRQLPKVDEVLKDEALDFSPLGVIVPKSVLLESINGALSAIRIEISKLEESQVDGFEFSYSDFIEDVKRRASLVMGDRLKRVINASGVVIHTNMGRSLISEKTALKALKSAIRYSNLELNLDTGKRGSRYDHLEDLICRLTGAEAAHVVNNNASAVMLVLSELASGSDVIVSRGELVEIGGSFRIPEIMKISSCNLVDVGCTNKTKLSDYSSAITEDTALLLKVHTSNYKILGFTEEVEVEDLVKLGKEKNLPVYQDIGSGSLIDLAKYGVGDEPTVLDSIRAGVDVVSFSGDKLLGGPQAGIIVGKKEYIDRMKKNQLTRALRLDKVMISLLEETLKIYLDEERALEEIPTLKMLTADYDDLLAGAGKLRSIFEKYPEDFSVEILDGFSEVGGGSLPITRLKTALLIVAPLKMSEGKLLKAFRDYDIPIIARVQEEKLIFDPRCILEDEYSVIEKALYKITGR